MIYAEVERHLQIDSSDYTWLMELITRKYFSYSHFLPLDPRRTNENTTEQ
jgi:hypothetical protein